MIAFLLSLSNFLLIENRACQISTAAIDRFLGFGDIQNLHITILIFSLIMFVLSFFNLASTINEFKIMFWGTFTCLILLSVLPIYNATTIASQPCRSTESNDSFFRIFDSSQLTGKNSIFEDPIDVMSVIVFSFNLITSVTLLVAAGYFRAQK